MSLYVFTLAVQGCVVYYIMNKERIIAELDYITNELGTAVPKLVSGSLHEIYIDMKLKSWLEIHHSAKHRAEIARMLRNLRMTNIKSFIDILLGLTLTNSLCGKKDHFDSTSVRHSVAAAYL